MGIRGLISTATTRGKGREVISCKRYSDTEKTAGQGCI